MKRNTLYTVNPWNQGIFGKKNQYSFGDFLKKDSDNYMGNWFGADKMSDNAKGMLGALGAPAGALAHNIFSNGYSSGIGEGITSVGSTVGAAVSQVNPVLGTMISLGSGVLGGVGNALFGSKVDQEALNRVNQDTAMLRNYSADAATFDDVKGIQGVANVGKVYKGGLFNKGVEKKNGVLQNTLNDAINYAYRAQGLNVDNLQKDQTNTLLRLSAAYGGPLGTIGVPQYTGQGALGIMQQDKYIDAINNRTNAIAKNNASNYSFSTQGNAFAGGGGMEAAFMDNFSRDPISAAMQYIQQRDALEEQREAEAAAAAQQAQFEDMQNRLMAAETQNQGLQSLIDNQALSIKALQDAQMAAMEESPSYAPADAEATVAPTVADRGDYAALRNFIKGQEGFRSKAYWLKGEKAPTIGYGFHMVYPGTNKPVKMGDTMTREEAEQGLTTVLRGIDNTLSKKVPNWDKLTSYQRDALIDLAYGTGTGGAHFRKNSRLMTALRNEDWAKAEKELVSRSASLPEYNKALLRRSKQRQDMFREGKYAFGGELGTNGTNFTNGLLEINTGLSHEENPYGGVQLGMDSQGVPNFVEEGETVFNDYVFSKRLMVPEFTRKQLGLGGNLKKELSFADASKKLAKDSKERPNSPLDQEYLENALGKLAMVQETERAMMQARQANEEMEMMNSMPLEGLAGLSAACGGKLNKYGFGGDMEEETALQRTVKGNMFAVGGEKEALKWVTKNLPNVRNKQAVARALWRKANSNKGLYYRPKVSMFGNSNQQPQWDFDTAYGNMVPTLARNSEKYFNEWVDAGLSPEDAYLMINRGRKPTSPDLLRHWENEKNRFINNRKAAQARNKPASAKTQRTAASSVPTVDWGSTATPAFTPAVPAPAFTAPFRIQYPATHAATSNAATQQQPAVSNAAPRTTRRQAAQNTTSARDTAPARRAVARRASTTPRNTRVASTQAAPTTTVPQDEFTATLDNIAKAVEAQDNQNQQLAMAQEIANQYGMPLEVANTIPTNGGMWNIGNYEWLSGDFQPSNGAEYIPYSRTMSADAIAQAENSDTFKNWSNYVLNNWDSQDVQNYLRRLDSVAGGNHLFDANGNPIEGARDYFTRERGIGPNGNHKWGFYHLTPTMLQNAAPAQEGQGAQTQGNGRIIHAMQGGDELPNDPAQWVNVGDEVDRRVLDDGTTVIMHAPKGAANPDNPTFTEDQIDNFDRIGDYEPRPYATWMRYAPAVGSGIMALTDALGLTNTPDYTYANKLEAAANNLGYAPNIRAPYIGDYMRYQPLDRLFYANQLQANARATDRNLMNTSGGNSGAARASMIANGYNTNNNLGNLYRQAEEYNLAQREKVADFNRRTNMFNAQMGLEADMANARYRQQAGSAQLSGLAQAAAMREAIDQRVGAARSANITNLLNNLGMIGRENFAFNQINSDRSRRHKVGINGWSYDDIARRNHIG